MSGPACAILAVGCQGGQDAKGTPEGGGIRMGRLRGAGRTPGSSLSEKPGGSARAGGGGGGGGGGYGDGDVAKLKEAIQTLCQSTHPLGETLLFCKWYHAAREEPREQRGGVELTGSTGHERCFHHLHPKLYLKLCIHPKRDPHNSGRI